MKINILVVEDTVIAQKIAKIILTELGGSIDIAENGNKALEMFKENNYDIIFMDIGLPDLSGIEVTKEIRKLESKASRVPIVALTANYDASCTSVFLEAGMDDFMLKPLMKENGQAMLDKFVKQGN